MKKLMGIGLFTLTTALSTQALAAGGCDALIDRLSAQIQGNGVPASEFTLEAVPVTQASQTPGEVIGNCENETRLVVYARQGRDYSAGGSSSSMNSAPAATGSQPSGGQAGSFEGDVSSDTSPQGTSDTPTPGQAPSDSLEAAPAAQ
ncbi:DUF1161 domain-containing protein [Halotalea alkalilenta]|uniref:DUF1161 domain-containing protein n=1 Tax=Halotalea alkalilenta TaxID=376489 RepID=UPI0006947EA4|nr:DUF1161 domain-containing protein [Halotalea alkalilenta]